MQGQLELQPTDAVNHCKVSIGRANLDGLPPGWKPRLNVSQDG
jgi:hypothetical protein